MRKESRPKEWRWLTYFEKSEKCECGEETPKIHRQLGRKKGFITNADLGFDIFDELPSNRYPGFLPYHHVSPPSIENWRWLTYFEKIEKFECG